MKGNRLVLVWVMLCTACQSMAQPHASCDTTHAYGDPWQEGDAVLFRTPKLNVDADGAPNSYLVDGKGLSYTCDGVVAIENGRRVTPRTDPAHWQEKCRAAWTQATASGDYQGVAIFGFLTDRKGAPIVQGHDDPMPGTGYISATSVVIPHEPDESQRRYVDAVRIPYVVLPGAFTRTWAVKPGSLAIVYRPKTSKYAFAVFGDGGDLGEASVRLHQDLGNDPMQLKDGVQRAKARIEDPVLTVVFPSRVSAPRAEADDWVADIKAQGVAALEAFGGEAMLAACSR